MPEDMITKMLWALLREQIFPILTTFVLVKKIFITFCDTKKFDKMMKPHIKSDYAPISASIFGANIWLVL